MSSLDGPGDSMGVDWEVGYMSLSSPVFHKGGGNDDMFNHPQTHTFGGEKNEYKYIYTRMVGW